MPPRPSRNSTCSTAPSRRPKTPRCKRVARDAELYIGLMSGTSLDAVDAALVDFRGASAALIATHRVPLDDLRPDLKALMVPGPDELARCAAADVALAERFAEACLGLLAAANVAAASVRAIGSHGQTLRHCPQERYTLQIGDPNVLCHRTGIPVVADLRRRDVAAGGQGAPLVPAFHAALWRATGRARTVVNIGGMANVTLLPADPDAAVLGFDTGPGNVLLDAWAQRSWQQPYDPHGRYAAGGQVQTPLLDALLAHPYFAAPPPKSTGRETFDEAWLTEVLDGREALAPEDVQATITELTARTIARAIETHAPETQEVFVCGGGAANDTLMGSLARQLAPRSVASTATVGLHPQWVEAVAFAWLARERLARRPGNLPSVTGAAQPVVLGGVYWP
ncbi:anhydro-N-acetylmuramic acid kinase [Ectothiorhodospiraceae bacterium 2226]|nr:anhydro-N-acetylmuramic acid kinase [Ectothiorhodospiraceae bacterium 2226]